MTKIYFKKEIRLYIGCVKITTMLSVLLVILFYKIRVNYWFIGIAMNTVLSCFSILLLRGDKFIFNIIPHFINLFLNVFSNAPFELVMLMQINELVHFLIIFFSTLYFSEKMIVENHGALRTFMRNKFLD